MKKKTLRESYRDGDIFRIGDTVVTTDGVFAEIINRGPNYVTLISEGNTFKKWLEDIRESKTNGVKQTGYKARNFNESLTELFSELETLSEDQYAVFNLAKCVDELLECSEDVISEDFDAVRINVERTKKYINKFSRTPLDFALVETIVNAVEETMLEYAILENVNYQTKDKTLISNVISKVANLEQINICSPISLVEESAVLLKEQELTSDGWKLVGRMFNKATLSGIEWDKTIFTEDEHKLMELI